MEWRCPVRHGPAHRGAQTIFCKTSRLNRMNRGTAQST
jgi:hypothetical protein